MHCRTARFCYRLLPLTAWRFYLLQRHIEDCPHCRGLAATDEEIRALAVPPVESQDEPPLRLPAPPPLVRPRPRPLRLAFGTTALLAICIAALLLWHRPTPPPPTVPEVRAVVTTEAPSFAVVSARIDDKPARAAVFKPRTSGMTIVWYSRI